MGYINDPKKAVYNKVYNKTTKSIFDNSYTSDNVSSSNLDSLTVAELKEILREKGLKVSGTKQELIDRLSNDTFQTANAQETINNNARCHNTKKSAQIVKEFLTIVIYVLIATKN